MSLFDKGLLDGLNVRTTSSIGSLSPAEGVAVFILSAVAADGHISEEEALMSWGAMSRMKLFRSYSKDVAFRLLDKVVQDFKRYKFEDVILAAKESIPYELRPTIFAIVSDIVLADGVLDESEEAILEMLHKLLEIPKDIAKQIIQSMAIKNRG